MGYDGISLVTGAAGFMGSHVVEYLVSKGVKVRATARPRKDISFFENLNVEYVPADLTKPETLPPLFEGNVDRVFHLGAICNFSTPYENLYPTNVKGVELLSTLAFENKVKKFVHVTSTSVYGYYTGKPYNESDKRNPADNYGKSKRDGEDVIFNMMTKGLPAIVVRPCTVYGARCNDGAGKAFSRPSSISAIPGNGNQLLSNIRAEDVARAILHLSENEKATGEIFNIAEDTNPTLEEALKLAAKIYGTKIPNLHLPLSIVKLTAWINKFIADFKNKIPDLEYDAVKYLYQNYVVDNSKIKDFGYEFLYPDFFSSMKELAKNYHKNK